MTAFEWLIEQERIFQEKKKREEELEKKHIPKHPERPVTGTFWTHQYKDHS